MRDQVKRTQAEIMNLESAALFPAQCSRATDVPQYIVKWEAAVRKSHEALPANSPDRLSERRQGYAMMRVLPTPLRQKGRGRGEA